MGVYLSAPIKEKESAEEAGGALQLKVGSSSMQGWRQRMEDAHFHHLDFDGNAFFGVFDGHGGPEVSEYVRRHLPDMLRQNESYKGGDYSKALVETYLTLDRKLARREEVTKEIFEISKIKKKEDDERKSRNKEDKSTNDSEDGNPLNAMISLLREMRKGRGEGENANNDGESGQMEEEEEEDESSLKHDCEGVGCTAVSVFMTKDKVICANSGDSRAVLCRGGKAVPLSFDHKPEDEIEFSRITKAGSEVKYGRVDGGLNLSRALGDLQYKKNESLPLEEQAVTPLPDIKIVDRHPEDEFLLMACDGIWEVKENDEAIAFARRLLIDEGLSPKVVCERLMDACLREG